MSAASIAATKKANPTREVFFRRFGRNLPLAREIARVSRTLWPVKTAEELASRTRTSVRTCRELLAERGGMSAPALAHLICCEEGPEFLEALGPVWADRLRRSIEMGALRLQLETQRARIAELELQFATQKPLFSRKT